MIATPEQVSEPAVSGELITVADGVDMEVTHKDLSTETVTVDQMNSI
jgi:hypothetical protein